MCSYIYHHQTHHIPQTLKHVIMFILLLTYLFFIFVIFVGISFFVLCWRFECQCHTTIVIYADEQVLQKKLECEIQLSIDNVPFKLCDNERILSSAKNYDVKYGLNDNKSAKLKIYIFNNLLVCGLLADENYFKLCCINFILSFWISISSITFFD